ncbi:MAG: 30S ribosomal protein S5 [bacterium]|nr:30S ribosomal protein S5 [bacterium]
MTEKKEQNKIQSGNNSGETAKSAAFGAKPAEAKKRAFRGGGGRRGGFRNKSGQAQEEFEQRIIDIARVTRVMAGGKRMRFRACVAIGNKKGKAAIGLAKGADVTNAVTKAVNKAKKNIIEIPIVNDTIPHEIRQKYGAAEILFKPARKGRGIIAGGAVRIIVELSGIKNITSKILGTNNKVNNVKCAIEALKRLKKI